ncbi:MAG: class II fructose-bisphosphatase [Chloroflexi bacterium]|nr:class II fructose-bisphosphatase [Chloroflexota bacterium]
MEMQSTIRRPFGSLGLDLVRATEGAALAAGTWMGLGKAEEADEKATEKMISILDTIEMDGQIIIGEGTRLNHHGPLQTGRSVGTGDGHQIDVVADPIDGRALLAQGHPGAISVVAVAPQGTLWAPTQGVYMEKIVVDSQVAPFLVPECMDAPAAWTLALVARAKHKRVSDLIAFVLDRPRHSDLVDEIRRAGARVILRSEGDIAGALMAISSDSGVDILMGVGGIAEGLIAACAAKATGGGMLGRLAPQDAEEESAIRAAGWDAGRILTVDEMVARSTVLFAATGITDGPLLSGVRYRGDRATSNSMILCGETSTRRVISAEHLLET